MSDKKKSRRGVLGLLVGGVIGYFFGSNLVSNILRERGIITNEKERVNPNQTVTITEQVNVGKTVTITKTEVVPESTDSQKITGDSDSKQKDTVNENLKQRIAEGSFRDWEKNFSETLKKFRGPITKEELGDLPKPYLGIGFSNNDIFPQYPSESIEVDFEIVNKGNFAAITCYIDLLDGPSDPHLTLSDYELSDRKIITLQPGEIRKNVKMSWNRKKSQKSGHLLGLLYDPLMDPKDWYLEEPLPNDNRHVAIARYQSTEAAVYRVGTSFLDK